jgi:hypothetical protein
VISERQFIKKALYKWVAAVVEETGRTDPVIWDHGDGTRPVPPFISLEFVGSSTPGMPYYSKVKVTENADGTFDDGEQLIHQHVRKVLTMYAFGEGAIDLLETVKASIFREEYINALYKDGLVIPDAMEIREGPQELSSDVENSAMFDFVLTFTRLTKTVPGWIEHVNLHSESILGDITIN